jgi:hypothetical protein
MKVRSLTLASLVSLLLTLALPLSANAQAPSPTTTIVPIDMTVVDRTCSFPLVEHIEGTQVTTDFFDDEGRLEQRLRHIILSATLTNLVTGTVVDGVHEALMVDRDFTTGAVTRHGLRLIVTVPGLGVVLLDAGTFVIDADGTVVFEAGPHQLLEGDVAQFCAAMSS